ncbi:MAG TPA: hypothetical protein VEH77_18320, partial [Roseiarcus sp.]|nr:hypothetical protein [Roseiarcus sp.]
SASLPPHGGAPGNRQSHPFAHTPMAAPNLTRFTVAQTPADPDRTIKGPFAALTTFVIAPRKPSRAAPPIAKSP